MDFQIAAVFKRSITIELLNDTICYAPSGYSILINGEEKLKSDLNVVTVDGLKPDTEYTITLLTENGRTDKTFRTEYE